MPRFTLPAAGLLTAGLLVAGLYAADTPGVPKDNLEWLLPNEAVMTPFAARQPITMITSTQNPQVWDKLPKFWNETQEEAVDPATGAKVMRKSVTIKVPLGLTQPPPVPAENPITVAKWQLGKKLYFDNTLSSNASVSCATCHAPNLGFTDQLRVSKGIHGKLGGISAPTVVNSAYNQLQFWDGRASSLEEQAQGPVQNPIEMFGGDGKAWDAAVQRVRQKTDYAGQFEAVFGTPATRDAMAKAIAAYERTVLSGNSIADRAEVAMRTRVEETGTGKLEVTAKDFETVLKDAFAKKDTAALVALKLDPAADAGRSAQVGAQLANGRAVFFGKARCNSCHVGENFTDNQFHNLGVGVTKEGLIPADGRGRFDQIPLGHKNPELMGAFKTPTLRHILGTAPYLHDGSEATLEQVVEFYDRGGNANEFLDTKMRDFPAEQAALRGQGAADVKRFGATRKPIIPLKLNLTAQEKVDLVLFLRALQGDPIDAMVADPAKVAIAK